MKLVGTIAKLQIQQSSLKVGQAPHRRYDPAPLMTVPALLIGKRGVIGLTSAGERVIDVHHLDHPASKSRSGSNGISVGFSSHYVTMRERFGPHLTDGLAGENILIETRDRYQHDDLTSPLLIETESGEHVLLEQIVVAEPCIEFSRFAMRYPDDIPPDRTVTETLDFLRRGMRGYYATCCQAHAVEIQSGNHVYLE